MGQCQRKDRNFVKYIIKQKQFQDHLCLAQPTVQIHLVENKN